MLGSAALCLSAALGCSPSAPGEWNDEGNYRWRELAGAGRRGPGFTQLDASKTGIDFANSVTESQMEQNRHLAQGSGVTLGDVDGDGLIDVYLARIDGPNALYRNLGDWRFEEVAEASGVSAPDRYSTGTAFADVDGDSDLDLLVSALGGPNALFENDGTGSFSERSAEVGLASDRGSMTMTLADVDGDGDLDLYVGNYKTLSIDDVYEPRVRAFDRVVREVGDSFEISPAFRDHYRLDVREELGLLVRRQRADEDWFYLNDGLGNFESVSFTSGRFLDANGAPIAEAPDYFVLSAKFVDVDGDLDPDLYICADFEDPDFFWINDGTGIFQVAPSLALRTTSNSAMALDFSDIDRDGDLDFFEADMLSSDGRRRQTQKPTHTPLPKLVGRIDDTPQMMRNTLFVNRGDNTYAQISYLAGVEASDWSWASLFLDVDLDGYEDILLSTGHVWDVMDYDTDERIRSSNSRVPWRRERFLYPQLHLENVLFRNNGDLTFDEVAEEWGFANEQDVSHGLATGDLDGDGDQDVVINRLGLPAGVFRNNASAGRVAVRLVGEAPNVMGIGATVRVDGGAVPSQQEEVAAGGVYLSSSDPMLTFGTGDAEQVSITVDWRSGRQTVIREAPANRLYEIRESGAGARTEGPTSTEAEGEQPIFVDESGLLEHIHAETDYDDYQRQPLLLNALSRLGPGVSWYDLDDDGDEDLLVTSGVGGTLSIYRNDGGSFSEVRLRLPPAEFDMTAVLPVPSADGGSTLLVGQSNYEALNPRAAFSLPSVIGFEIGPEIGSRSMQPTVSAAVAPDTSSTGVLALADYDADGDLDLFVGGRVIPGAYPAPASSRLLKNEGGAFVLDEYNRHLLARMGMVSAATFSDVDSDGDPDLLLATEWGPIQLLLNQRGVFSAADSSYGFAAFSSRWNGLTTGDLDGDGRLDVVATSWGRNTKHDPSERIPLQLYYGDFDYNGSMDLLEAQYDPAYDDVYPLESMVRLASVLPQFRQRIPDFETYSTSNISDVLGQAFRATRRFEINTFDNMVFLNRGDSFEGIPMPTEAQFAPAFYAGVADFDGDGNEDVFLSQNFFPTDWNTPRYDAGRGLLMLGDGSGSLEPVPGQESGILVYGDQRGAAFSDYDGDARLDLVVTQNGAATRLYRNVGAEAGLRIRLLGPPRNPYAVGASIRMVYADGMGPIREVHAGSGYWSQDGLVQVMGLRDTPAGIWVRWPDGTETETRLDRDAVTPGSTVTVGSP